MLRRLLPAALVLATLAAFAAPASAAPNCLPDVSGPRWIDYATSAVGFRDDLFRRSGLTLALDDLPVRRDDPAKAFRDAGASEVYWEEHMEEIVGRPASPKPAVGIDQAVGTLVAEARTATGCGDPVIALNELLPPAGASGASMARYRENVLAMLTGIGARSARPVLLLPATTPTTGDGADFLRRAVPLADLVVEVYFNNRNLSAQGPLLASRAMRQAIRRRVVTLLALGAQPAQLGIMLGFMSAAGQAGREGLQPTSAWLDMVKLNALAAQQVAREAGAGTIWSWGWGTFENAGSADADKPAAACVYLWTRDQSLCDAPARGQFNPSLTDGQLILPAGVQCGWDGGAFSQRDVARLARALKGDRARALSALLERVVVRAAGRATSRQVTLAERAIVRIRFGGSARRYKKALRQAKISRAGARQVIAGQIAQRAAATKVRPQSFAVWLTAQERTALSTMTCVADELPAAADVDLTTNLPFLRVAARPDAPATPTAPSRPSARRS